MPRYEKPPIVESVFECRFPADSAWDLAVPGLLYQELKDLFPQRERRLFGEMRFENVPEGLLQQVRPVEQVIFRTLEKNTYVQISSGKISVHRQPPYGSWRDFGPLVGRVIKTAANVMGQQKTERLGLRYINRVTLPGEIVDLEEYFDFRPNPGDRLPKVLGRFHLLVEFPFAEARDLCRVQLSTALAEQPSHSAFLLDLDYFNLRQGAVDLTGAPAWIEEAHTRIEDAFEGCITDRSRVLFGRIG